MPCFDLNYPVVHENEIDESDYLMNIEDNNEKKQNIELKYIG